MADSTSFDRLEKLKSIVTMGGATHVLNVRLLANPGADVASIKHNLIIHLTSGYQKYVRGSSNQISIEWDPVHVKSYKRFYSKNIYNDNVVSEYVNQIMTDFCETHKCRLSWIVSAPIR